MNKAVGGVLILANIAGFILIFVLCAGLWTLLSGLLGGMILLGLTWLEEGKTPRAEVLDESIDRLLREVRESSHLVDALSEEIRSIQHLDRLEKR